MDYCLLSYKDIKKTVIWKFQNFLSQYKDPFVYKEEIYIKAFRQYLVLTEYGVFPKEAAQSLNEMTKLHFGYDLDEILALTMRYAVHSTNEMLGIQDTDKLSEEEMKVITDYHSILFGKFHKKEYPLKNEL